MEPFREGLKRFVSETEGLVTAVVSQAEQAGRAAVGLVAYLGEPAGMPAEDVMGMLWTFARGLDAAVVGVAASNESRWGERKRGSPA